MSIDDYGRADDGTRQPTPGPRGSALNGNPDLLRQLVREVLAEALPELARPGGPPDRAQRFRPTGASQAAVPGPLPPSPPTSDPASDPAPDETAHPSPEITIDARIHQASRGTAAATGTPSTVTRATSVTANTATTGAAGTAGPAEPWTVRLSTDEELHTFVLRVLRLAGNPKLRSDLISGRARFRLAVQADGAAARAVHRVDKGAVTERAVGAAAKAGARLVLGPRAVLTPLARDKAQALGVPIEKER